MTLTEENLNEMQMHIDVSRLTKTFREAMEMTVRLGVRYIWIDSLCIIQNSTAGEDWRIESRLMGDVYQNALCNLGATKAKDGNDGLFTERMLFNIRPCVIESHWYDSKHLLAAKKMPLKLTSSSQWDKNSERSPLLKRAWVVQEQTLSRRMLHFGEDQMSWECLELKTDETSWDRSTFTVGKLSLDRGSRMPASTSLYIPVDAEAVDYRIWGQIVTKYSACDLTFPAKDKFVAISSIARNVCAGDTYLAGLWKNDLPGQLNWVTDSQKIQCRRASPWRAPSWSWASIDGPVFFRSPLKLDRSTALHILNTEVTPAEGEIDNYGQIIFGKIQLVCTLLKLKYFINSPSNDHFCLIKDKTANLYHDVEAFKDSRLLTCLPIYLSEQDNIGLILERSEGSRGEYRRVGKYTIRVHNNVKDKTWMKDILEAVHTGKNLVGGQNEGDEYMWNMAFIAASKSDWMNRRITEDDYEAREGMTSDGIPQFRISLV
ncbi:hypothetical protein MMC11_005176 [Xylographa trunciseda]|nr:hypothetical protein [Xylographa trunciseda]